MPPDSLRAVLDSVFAGPDYAWREAPQPLGVVARWFALLQEWVTRMSAAHPTGFRLLLAALVVAMVAILVHAGYVVFRTIRGSDAVLPAAEPAPRRDEAWYRREAERLARDGRFVEAMQAEFLALVLALDRAALLRFHPAKTPAEYAAEPRLTASARKDFTELVRGLYGYAFARWPCGPEEYARWRVRAAPERYATAH